MGHGTASVRFAPAFVSLLLIGGIWLEHQMFHLPAGDAAEYHERIKAVADQLPLRIGAWSGTKVDPPQAAITLLRPNLTFGREYVNAETGEHVRLMIVQCRDARDMGGHWPPVCYPAHGWTLRDSAEQRLLVDTLTIPVSMYRFTMESIEQYTEIVIYGFFMRPDGILESGRDGVRRAAEDPRLKIFGAAQMQVAFDASMDKGRRDEVFRDLVAGVLPVIEAVRRGSQR